MKENFTDVMKSGMGKAMKSVHTAIPAEVTSFDPDTRKVSARPVVRDNADGVYTDFPEIYEIPVQYPASSKAGICFPLERGDTGMLIFCQADIEGWCQRGGMQNPGTERKWDLTDAIFVPGVFPFNEKKPEIETGKLVIWYNESKITIGSKVTIENSSGQSMAGLIDSLFTTLAGAVTTGSPVSQVLNPATISSLNALKAQFAQLLE
jgi:hypothetical protein